MNVNRRRALATWVAGVLLLPLGVLASGAPAAATPVTPNLPTIDITLPPGVTQTTLDTGSKDTDYAPTTISAEDSSGTVYPADPSSGKADLVVQGPVVGEIKGRGNYTWRLAKKPYQIKLDSARPLLGLPAAKTWVLLANHADASLMRNKLAFDLANSIGMPFSSQSRWVDLRINGQYRGNYLLTEKVEVKANRVEMTDPKGILAELDNNYGTAEDYYFYTGASKTLFTLKDAKSGVPDKVEGPLPADTQAGWDDMKATLNKLDSLLAASSPNWTEILKVIDLESFVRFYFVNELTENPEITSSSIYFYKDGTTDKLHAGPVWDFDSALGNYDKAERFGAFTESEYTKNAQILRAKGNGWYYELFRNPQFVQKANEMWTGGIAYQVNALPGKIDTYKAQVQASAAKNFAMWKILGGPTLLLAGSGKDYATTYDGEVAYLKNWVSKRSTHLQKAYGKVPNARYQSHVQNLGWRPFVDSGQISGTVGRALRMEALNLSLQNSTGVTGSVTGNAHVQNLGWSGWKSTSLLGTTGRSLRLEAVQLKLTGNLALKYDISYRGHVAGVGWQPWRTNGATAGTTGQSRSLEAIQVRLLHKTPPTPVAGP